VFDFKKISVQKLLEVFLKKKFWMPSLYFSQMLKLRFGNLRNGEPIIKLSYLPECVCIIIIIKDWGERGLEFSAAFLVIQTAVSNSTRDLNFRSQFLTMCSAYFKQEHRPRFPFSCRQNHLVHFGSQNQNELQSNNIQYINKTSLTLKIEQFCVVICC